MVTAAPQITGAGDGNGLFDGLYGPGPIAFQAVVDAWMADGAFAGLRIA